MPDAGNQRWKVGYFGRRRTGAVSRHVDVGGTVDFVNVLERDMRDGKA